MVRDPAGGGHGVGPGVAVALTTVGFLALAIAGLGLVSLLADVEVIAVPGLGPAPGAVALAAGGAAFALSLWRSVHTPRPGYVRVIGVVVATAVAYAAAAGLTALVVTGGLGTAVGLLASLLVGWPGLIVAASAVVSAWSAIALVRTRSGRPRWSWESERDR